MGIHNKLFKFNMESKSPNKDSKSERRRLSVSTVNQDQTTTKTKQKQSNYQEPVMGKMITDKHAHKNEEEKESTDTLLPTTKKTGKRLSFCGALSDTKEKSYSDKCVVTEGENINANELEKQHLMAFACHKGLKPEAPNQDDFLVMMQDNYILLCVFDGHGPYGHDVSDFVTKRLPNHLFKHMEKNNISVSLT